MRVGKTVDTVATSYLQDQVGGLPHAVLETTGQNETLYIYGLGLALHVNPDGSRRYYHTDALGSTRVVTDDSGQVVSGYSYDAFGAVRDQAGEGKGFTYTGEQTDETSLVFLRARHYDPPVGRFISRDPFAGYAGISQSLNRYVYVLNAPTQYTDPSGEWVHIVAGAAAGGVLSYGAQVVGNVQTRGFTAGAFTDVDLGEVAVGAVAGAVGAGTFGVGTAALGTSLAGRLGASALSGTVSGQAARATGNVASGKCLTSGLGDPGDLALDAAFGAAGAGVAAGMARASAHGAAAGRSGLSTGRVPPAAEAAKRGVAAGSRDITFGHGARHLGGTGLQAAEVEAAISRQVEASVRGAADVGPFWGRVAVQGRVVEYRAFPALPGVINIGTYYLVQ